MSGFQTYDQWKTASPYDNEPDPIEEAILWIELSEKAKKESRDEYYSDKADQILPKPEGRP